jgi:hypothetical protein
MWAMSDNNNKIKVKHIKTGKIYNAVQWFKYGDHGSVGYNRTTYDKFYRKRKYGVFNVIKIKCPNCGKKYHGEHGAIKKRHDKMVEIIIICPGDWIVGQHHIKDKYFKENFEII